MSEAKKILAADVTQFFPLDVWKMHGCGNDFVVFHIENQISDEQLSSLATYLCNRNFGIGAGEHFDHFALALQYKLLCFMENIKKRLRRLDKGELN